MADFSNEYAIELEKRLAGLVSLHEAKGLSSNAAAHLNDLFAEYKDAGFSPSAAEELALDRFGQVKTFVKNTLISKGESRHPLAMSIVKLLCVTMIPLLFLATYNFLYGFLDWLPGIDTLIIVIIAAIAYICVAVARKKVQWWAPITATILMVSFTVYNWQANPQKVAIIDNQVVVATWYYDKGASAFLTGANSQLEMVEGDLNLALPLAGYLGFYPDPAKQGWVPQLGMPSSAKFVPAKFANGPPSASAFSAYLQNGITQSSIEIPIPLGAKMPYLNARSQWIKVMPTLVSDLNSHFHWGLPSSVNPHQMNLREFTVHQLPAPIVLGVFFFLLELIPSILSRGVLVWRVQRMVEA